MISRGGALGRAGKTKNLTPFVEPKDEKKKTGRAKMRSAKPHESNAMSKSTEFDKQEFSCEKQEHHAIRYRTGPSDTRIQNTKKPNNLAYKHVTNSHREEVHVTSEQLDEGWIVVGKKRKP